MSRQGPTDPGVWSPPRSQGPGWGTRAPAARIPSPDLGAPGGPKRPEWMNSRKIWIHSLPLWSVVGAQLPFSYQETVLLMPTCCSDWGRQRPWTGDGLSPPLPNPHVVLSFRSGCPKASHSPGRGELGTLSAPFHRPPDAGALGLKSLSDGDAHSTEDTGDTVSMAP